MKNHSLETEKVYDILDKIIEILTHWQTPFVIQCTCTSHRKFFIEFSGSNTNDSLNCFLFTLYNPKCVKTQLPNKKFWQNHEQYYTKKYIKARNNEKKIWKAPDDVMTKCNNRRTFDIYIKFVSKSISWLFWYSKMVRRMIGVFMFLLNCYPSICFIWVHIRVNQVPLCSL